MKESELEQLLRLHDEAQGEAVLKSTPRHRVTRVEHAALGACVCKEERRAPWRRWVGLIWPSRARRSLAAARALTKAGFIVPQPLGVLERRQRSLYFTRYVAGRTLSHALAIADRDTAHGLATRAARLTAALHGAGFALRDLKPPNLVLSDEGSLLLVDLDDVRRGGERYRSRNLASLDAYGQWGPRPLGVRTRWQALEAYCLEGQGEPKAWWEDVLRLSRAKRQRWQRSNST